MKCFPSGHTTPEKFENTVSLDLCFLGKLLQENHVIIMTSSFSKGSVFKTVSVHTKTQSWVFKFLRFDQRFRKAPFS